MNTITLERLTSDKLPTVGIVRINGIAQCFSLEDRLRQEKVAGDTRIWPGEYPLEWRAAGRWAKRFQGWGYPGSLELKGVREFSDVLIHVGNTKGDTEGCILLGQGASFHERTVSRSVAACKALYAKVAACRSAAPWRIIVS